MFCDNLTRDQRGVSRFDVACQSIVAVAGTYSADDHDSGYVGDSHTVVHCESLSYQHYMRPYDFFCSE